MTKRLRTFIVLSVLVSFIGSSVQMPAFAQIDPMPWMPKPGDMVHLSPEYTPAYLKGIVIHPENALKFDFIIYKGDKPLTDAQKRVEYTKLTKYFLASLAIPDDDQWVNLSPYEKDRIIKDNFGKTEMGRDLLAQDYLLKQITASLIYPESQLGKEFWKKVYAQAQKQYGTTNIPVNTFNKVWILPDDALIYEKGNTAYVLKNHLRVMLEEDYLSLQKHSGIENVSANKTHSIASKIVREIVLPELQKEVNEDANFAPLRQVYSGMLLATWFKRTLKQSLLGQIYANKGKVRGVDQDPRTNEKIYQRYLQAYKKGVFNFIKEDADRLNNAIMPRKYFSGGMVDDYAQIIQVTDRATLAQKETITGEENYDDAMSIVLKEDKTDEAMSAKQGTTTRVTFVQGTDTNRNNYLSYVIALPWFKATTGIDTTQGRRSIIDVGSSFGLTIPGLWGALKRVNPDFELTVTELPRTVPKAYIRSGRFWSSKGFAVIARDFAYKLYPNQIRDIMLVVDENYSIPEAVMLDSDGFTRIATSAETVSYMHGEPEKNLKTPLLGNMLGMLNDKNLADPKHLKQLIEASRSNAVDPDLSIEPDPLQAKFSKLGIGFQATEFPDLAKATSPAIIFYSHVLDHYPDDLRRRYWNTLQENLREKDVVITNDHVGSGTVKIVIYQKRRKKLINLGTINFNPRMLRAQSKEIDVTNYDRRRLAARFYMALVYKFKYRWPQLLRLVKNRSYIKAQMARIGRTDRQALEEAIKAAEAFTGSQIIFTEEQKEKLLSGDAAMGAGTDAAMRGENSVLTEQFPNKAEQFLENGVSHLSETELTPQIADALNEIKGFPFKKALPEAEQVKFIAKVIEILGHVESRNGRIRAIIALSPEDQTITNYIADQILKQTQMVLERSKQPQTIDVVGIFLKHSTKIDFEQIHPVLEKILAVARKQKRPVIFSAEGMVPGLQDMVQGQLVGTIELQQLMEELKDYYTHISRDQAFDIERLTTAKSIYRRLQEAAIRKGPKRLDPSLVRSNPYGYLLETFFNTLYADKTVNITIQDEEINFSTWLDFMLYEYSWISNDIKNALKYLHKSVQIRDTELTVQALSKIKDQYKDKVKPIVVIFRGTAHFRLMDSLDIKSMRGISGVFDRYRLTDPYEHEPWVLASNLLNNSPDMPVSIIDGLLNLQKEADSIKKELTVPGRLSPTTKEIMEQLITPEWIAQVRPFISEIEPINYYGGDSAMRAERENDRALRAKFQAEIPEITKEVVAEIKESNPNVDSAMLEDQINQILYFFLYNPDLPGYIVHGGFAVGIATVFGVLLSDLIKTFMGGNVVSNWEHSGVNPEEVRKDLLSNGYGANIEEKDVNKWLDQVITGRSLYPLLVRKGLAPGEYLIKLVKVEHTVSYLVRQFRFSQKYSARALAQLNIAILEQIYYGAKHRNIDIFLDLYNSLTRKQQRLLMAGISLISATFFTNPTDIDFRHRFQTYPLSINIPTISSIVGDTDIGKRLFLFSRSMPNTGKFAHTQATTETNFINRDIVIREAFHKRKGVHPEISAQQRAINITEFRKRLIANFINDETAMIDVRQLALIASINDMEMGAILADQISKIQQQGPNTKEKREKIVNLFFPPEEFPDRAMITEFPDKVEQFLERGVSQVSEEELRQRIADALDKTKGFPFKSIIPEGKQGEFISQVLEILGRVESRSGRKKEILGLSTGERPFTTYIADQILSQTQAVLEQSRQPNKVDVVGIFLKHDTREDFDEAHPTLNRILTVAKKQMRPVIFLTERGSTSLEDLQDGTWGVQRDEFAKLITELDDYYAHISQGRSFDIERLNAAKRIFNKEREEIRKERKGPRNTKGYGQSYLQSLEDFYNTLYLEKDITATVLDEEMDFSTWLYSQLNDYKGSYSSTSRDALEFFLKYTKSREDILTHQTLDKLTNAYKGRVKPIVVIVWGTFHFNLMQKLNLKTMRGMSLIFSDRNVDTLVDPYLDEPFVLAFYIRLLFPEAPESLIGELLKLEQDIPSVQKRLTVPGRPVPTTRQIMEELYFSKIMAEIKPYISKNIVEPISYFGDSAMSVNQQKRMGKVKDAAMRGEVSKQEFENWGEIGGVFLFDYPSNGERRFVFLGKNPSIVRKPFEQLSHVPEDMLPEPLVYAKDGHLERNNKIRNILAKNDFKTVRVYVKGEDGNIHQVEENEREKEVLSAAEYNFFDFVDPLLESFKAHYLALSYSAADGKIYMQGDNDSRFVIDRNYDRISFLRRDEVFTHLNYEPQESDIYFGRVHVPGVFGQKNIILKDGKVIVEFTDNDEGRVQIYRQGQDIMVEEAGKAAQKLLAGVEHRIRIELHGDYAVPIFGLEIIRSNNDPDRLGIVSHATFGLNITYMKPNEAMIADKALIAGHREDLGGIDLNSANLHLVIKRDGQGVPLPFAQQDLAQLSGIQGFVPEIIEIKPASTLELFSSK